MLETEFREESLAIAQKLTAHAAKTGRTPMQFALAWLWANRIVTSVIAGPRTLEQWKDYVGAIGTRVERRGRGARRFAGQARTSVDAGLQRSAVSVLRARARVNLQAAGTVQVPRMPARAPRLGLPVHGPGQRDPQFTWTSP